MPVIDIDFNDLKGLMGKAGQKLDKETFLERVPMIGSDIEEVEGDNIKVEFFPNRPDLYSVEGVARAMAAFLGYNKGLRHYSIEKAELRFGIQPPGVPIRPYVVGGIARDVKFTDQFIKSLMDVQEKLHGSLGRGRKKVAIGLHDMDEVEPPFTYKAVDPESVTFVPLDMQEEMDLRDILRKHDKGREYGWILTDSEYDKWPLIVDNNEEVLSFPPIINGELTAIKEGTKNVFIDVTGVDATAVHHALNILCAMFADRGGKLEGILIGRETGKDDFMVPELRPGHMHVKTDYINGWLGTDMGPEDIKEALERMGHNVHVKGKDFTVEYPAYRKDILHPVDIAEDVAIGYGYERFTPEEPRSMTVGSPRPVEVLSNKYRKLLVGLGFLEVTTLTLSSDEDEFGKLGQEVGDRSVIMNPTSETFNNMRVSMIPSLLKILAANKHRELPQRIFEVADVILGHRNIRHAAALSIHDKASFTEMKSVVLSLLGDMSIEHRFQAANHPGFMEGRCSAIIVGNDPIGHFGEVSPETIVNFELEFPIAGFELRI
jgi:phenylalanyl-tRNA synthetase beta chain